MILKKAFATDPKKSSPEFNVKDYLSEDQLKDIFQTQPDELTLNPEIKGVLAEKPSQLLNSMELLKSLAAPPLVKSEVTVNSDESDLDFEDDEDEEEEYVEFKFAPRPIYMATICQVNILIFC